MSAMIPESIRELAAGYALGALTPDETRQFEAALATFPELEREVADYREVNGLLALRGGERPSDAVRDRLMQRFALETVAGVPRRPGASWWISAALAATTILAVGLGLRVRSLGTDLDRTTSELAATAARLARREATLNTLLTAEADLQVVHLTTDGTQAPGIQFFWNRRVNRGVLYAFRLPPADPGKVYQLWLIPRGGAPIPSQTFTSEPDGHALVEAFDLPTEVRIEAAAITLEPEGGSSTPTMPIVLMGTVGGT